MTIKPEIFPELNIGTKFNTLTKYGDKAYKVHNITPADVALLTGKAPPTYMWRGSDPVNANELVNGAETLLEPDGIHNYFSPVLKGITTDLAFNTRKFISTNPLVIDVPAGSAFAIMDIRHVTAFTTTSNLYGKRLRVPPYTGFEIYSFSTGTLQFVCNSASGQRTASVGLPHPTGAPIITLAKRNITTNNQQLFSDLGSSTIAGFTDSLESSEVFSIGQARLSGTVSVWGVSMVWVGPSAELVTDADRVAIKTALGL